MYFCFAEKPRELFVALFDFDFFPFFLGAAVVNVGKLRTFMECVFFDYGNACGDAYGSQVFAAIKSGIGYRCGPSGKDSACYCLVVFEVASVAAVIAPTIHYAFATVI